jgi:mono/diheme cytochrome c family protein
VRDGGYELVGVKRTVGILVFLVSAAVLTWVGVAFANQAATKRINVTLRDTKISLSAKSAPVGTVTFVVKNAGKLVHDFRIGGKMTKALAPGKTAKLVVTFKVAKSYPYLSTLPRGKTKGLRGVFKTVGEAAPRVVGDAKAGKATFVSTCGACHTLKAAGTVGQIGPNLDQVGKALTEAVIIKAITDGGAAVMTKAALAKYPTQMVAYKGVLATGEIENVAAFIYTSTHP